MSAPAPRRALAWGIVVIALATAAGVGVAFVRRASGTVAAIGGPPAPPRITQQVVVQRLETVAKLVSSEMTLRDVVTYEQTRYGSTKKALLVVTARVSAGINLGQGAKVDIDSTLKRIYITLPPASILGVDVLNVTTYDERSGLLNPFRPEDRDIIQRRVRHQLMESARQSGILEHADRSAQQVLMTMLAQDGYTVEIRHPPVQRAPTG